MLEPILWGTYGLSCLGAWRLVFRSFYQDFADGWGLPDLLLGILLATLFMPFIGFVALPYGLYSIVDRHVSDEFPTRIARMLAGESRKSKLERKREQARELEVTIKQLERECLDA